MALTEFVKNTIWLLEYPIRFFAMDLSARMTVVRLSNGTLLLHSPSPMDEQLRAEIDRLGPVSVIIAPGNFHHLHVITAQLAYPEAEILICPGVEQKQPRLSFTRLLGDQPDPALKADLFGLKNIRVPPPVTSESMVFPDPCVPVTNKPSVPSTRTAPASAVMFLPAPAPPWS